LGQLASNHTEWAKAYHFDPKTYALTHKANGKSKAQLAMINAWFEQKQLLASDSTHAGNGLEKDRASERILSARKKLVQEITFQRQFRNMANSPN